MNQKRCGRCGKTKPYKEFYNNRRRADGKSFYCISCLAEKRKERLAKIRAENEGSDPQADPEPKKCGHCGKIKPRTEFYRHRSTKGGLHSTCKQCMRKQAEKHNHSLRAAITTQRANAKNRGIDFLLTKHEATTLMNMPCHYCGAEPGIDRYNQWSGLDRVDNTGPYSIDNCVPCCWWCNNAKKQDSVEEFIEHCRKVVQVADGRDPDIHSSEGRQLELSL